MLEGIGIDAEPAAWVGGVVTRGPEMSDGVRSGGSWAIARVADYFVMIYAGRYASRPGHSDVLHLDVFHRGREIIIDPGTFAYNAPVPWNNGLANSRVHNGPLLDDQEPGLRGPRFLWLKWPSGAIKSATWDGREACIVAERPGAVRRTVTVGTSGVRVRDTSLADDAKVLHVRWLVSEANCDSEVVQAKGSLTVPAQADDVVGWYSHYYQDRVAGSVIEVRSDSSARAGVETSIACGSGTTISSAAEARESTPTCESL